MPGLARHVVGKAVPSGVVSQPRQYLGIAHVDVSPGRWAGRSGGRHGGDAGSVDNGPGRGSSQAAIRPADPRPAASRGLDGGGHGSPSAVQATGPALVTEFGQYGRSHFTPAEYIAGMAWLTTISRTEAVGDLADTYAAMAARPLPEAYRPPHGDAPGIIRAHSLDVELMRRTFRVSGALRQSPLDWADWETVSSVTSRTNQCFY
jgi:hypothetical protein